MPEIISTFEFWVTILTVFGAGRMLEMLVSRFLNRKKLAVETGAQSLKFMSDRMRAMEEEMDRQNKEIKNLKSAMHELQGEYQKVSNTLYEVTETVEQHGSPDVIQRVREIPGVPTVVQNK